MTNMQNASFFLGKIMVATFAAGACVSACSAPPTDGAFGSGAGGRGGSGNSSANGGEAGNGSSSSANGGVGGGSASASGGNGGNGGSGGACTAKVYEAVPVPFGMYLMMDKSGSMQGANWTNVTNAIKAFVDQPSTAGIGLGLDFFPPVSNDVCPTFCNTDVECGTCGKCVRSVPTFPGTCDGVSASYCDVNEYKTPTVGIANLPGASSMIKSALDMTSPNGGTPTSAALDGAIQYTKQWMTTNPNAIGVAIFATDGAPTECDTDVQNIYAIAAAGLAGTPSVRTYVIGVGDLPFLDDLAAAGGTVKAFKVDTNANAQAEFLQAMNSIRGAALSCAYLIPPAPAGEEIDYNAINVQYTPMGGMPVLIPKAQSEAACPATGMAWYYDNATPPQQILLCPTTCSQISADTSGQVDVLVGCATVIN